MCKEVNQKLTDKVAQLQSEVEEMNGAFQKHLLECPLMCDLHSYSSHFSNPFQCEDNLYETSSIEHVNHICDVPEESELCQTQSLYDFELQEQKTSEKSYVDIDLLNMENMILF